MPGRHAVWAVEQGPSEQLVGVMLSTTPSQLSSMPLHTSATGEPAVTEQVVVAPVPQTTVPVRAQAPTPTVHEVPVGAQVPLHDD